MLKIKRKLNKKQQIAVEILAFVLILVFAVLSYLLKPDIWNGFSRTVAVNESVNAQSYPFSVHYIDVGQADCELIVSGDDAILVDAGDVDSYNTIKAYLDSQGIERLSYFIISHAHADHIGSADEIIENYPIDNVIMTRLTENNTPTSSVYEDLLNALSGCSAKIIPATPGNTYNLNDFSFTVFAPVKDYDELNNTSVVFKAVYKNTSFLFTGDAEADSEKDILKSGYDIKADVLKVGHHGSSTSTKKNFLEAVNPKFAVISCGVDNSYNHPSEDTLDRLVKYNIQYKRTDINGTVVVTSDGDNINIITER